MVYVNRIVTINVNLMGYWLILTVSMCSSELYKPQRRNNANGGIVSIIVLLKLVRRLQHKRYREIYGVITHVNVLILPLSRQ